MKTTRPNCEHNHIRKLLAMADAGALDLTPGSAQAEQRRGSAYLRCATRTARKIFSRKSRTYRMIIGIDPGLAGAVAILDNAGALLALHDTPTLTLKVNRGMRQEYDLPGMVRLLTPYAGNNTHAILEESQAMPGQGVRSMFTIGVGFGVWLGVLATLEIPYTKRHHGRAEALLLAWWGSNHRGGG